MILAVIYTHKKNTPVFNRNRTHVLYVRIPGQCSTNCAVKPQLMGGAVKLVCNAEYQDQEFDSYRTTEFLQSSLSQLLAFSLVPIHFCSFPIKLRNGNFWCSSWICYWNIKFHIKFHIKFIFQEVVNVPALSKPPCTLLVGL